MTTPDPHAWIAHANLFLCNSNRREGVRVLDDPKYFERLMFDNNYALAWTYFDYEARMHEVRKGDVIVLWAKNVGAIGLGRALGSVQIVGPSGNRLFTGFDDPPPPADEWRIPVEWLAYVRDEDAYPWHGKGMNFTFARVDNDRWRETAHAAIRHLLAT